MTPNERAEMINLLELVTGYSEEYLMMQTDEKLLQIHKERVEYRG